MKSKIIREPDVVIPGKITGLEVTLTPKMAFALYCISQRTGGDPSGLRGEIDLLNGLLAENFPQFDKVFYESKERFVTGGTAFEENDIEAFNKLKL